MRNNGGFDDAEQSGLSSSLSLALELRKGRKEEGIMCVLAGARPSLMLINIVVVVVIITRKMAFLLSARVPM